jgi:glutamyl-tRNA synthetase
VLRVEDLDPATRTGDPTGQAIADRQLADLRALGIDWDGPVMVQSQRLAHHHDAIERLIDDGRTYPCWCSRREVAEAAQAPNQPGLPDGAYPGTCARLGPAQRARRAADTGREPALRLRAEGAEVTLVDMVRGRHTGIVDDFVVRRADGVPAYNLAVIIDDADQGVDQVVRGDDLLDSTPRQILLHQVLGMAVPTYAHVPLVFDADGERLAKRGAATTLGELVALGVAPSQVLARLAGSLGLAEPGEAVTPAVVLDRFNPDAIDPTSTAWQPWLMAPGAAAFGGWGAP